MSNHGQHRILYLKPMPGSGKRSSSCTTWESCIRVHDSAFSRGNLSLSEIPPSLQKDALGNPHCGYHWVLDCRGQVWDALVWPGIQTVLHNYARSFPALQRFSETDKAVIATNTIAGTSRVITRHAPVSSGLLQSVIPKFLEPWKVSTWK